MKKERGEWKGRRKRKAEDGKEELSKGRKKRGKKNGNTTREGTHSVLFIVSAGQSVRVC